MTPEQIDRVFGRGRLKMVTGEHVEVYREAVAPGERRRYTKRFLDTPQGDFGQWTEREWRILARLIGHGITCVPDVVQIDRGRFDGAQLVQTYDAGVTVDQWGTLLPVTRDGHVYGHVFEDCAHWWALAHHCILALNVIHPLELVHLDIKGDNVCIPYSPASFDPDSSDLHLQPVFGQLALIDFAFALISRASLTTPLPIGWQKDYDYQSPRLLAALEAGRNGDLQATRDLDWRCDLYSLAAMLKRYLPNETSGPRPPGEAGWTPERYDAAKALILRIREFHDGELPRESPHAELIEITGTRLRDDNLTRSLERGWTLAREASVAPAFASPLTPVTLLAPPIRVARSGRVTAVTVLAGAGDRQTVERARTPAVPLPMSALPPRKRYERASAALMAAVALAAVGTALWYAGDRPNPLGDRPEALLPADAANDDERDAARLTAQSEEPARRAVANADTTASGDGVAAQEPPPKPSETAAGVVAEPAPPAVANGASDAAGASREETANVKSPTPDTAVMSSRDAATPPAVSPDAPRRETPAVPRAQPRGTESRTPALDVRKAPPAISARQAAAAQRSADKVSRAQAGTAQRLQKTRASAKKETREPKERVYAPWASLEPPAWALSSYRGKGPGVPRGATASETRTPSVASSVESAPAASAPVSTSVPLTAPPLSMSAPAASAPVSTSVALAATAAPAPSAAPSPAATRNESVASNPQRASPAPGPDDYAALGRQMLQEAVPPIAARAEPQVARVLSMAAGAYHLLEERAVAEASRAARVADVDLLPLQRTGAPAEARRLNDEARAAIRSHRDVGEAMELQLRAFAANPRDPEVAGNLASLYLKLTPAQPEMARQIALVALAARAPQYHSARMEDWHTFAIASALTGRESDARNALYVTLALTADVDTRCIVALNAVSTYGDRLRRPVESMFYRLHSQGRGIGSQACAWPPNGSLVSRLQ